MFINIVGVIFLSKNTSTCIRSKGKRKTLRKCNGADTHTSKCIKVIERSSYCFDSHSFTLILALKILLPKIYFSLLRWPLAHRVSLMWRFLKLWSSIFTDCVTGSLRIGDQTIWIFYCSFSKGCFSALWKGLQTRVLACEVLNTNIETL